MASLSAMRVPHLLCALFVIAALAAGEYARAEIYKWVDEKGVTNYSNEPPPDSTTPASAVRLEDRLSVYTPDEALIDAVAAARRQRHEGARSAPRAPSGPAVGVIGAGTPPGPAEPCRDCRDVEVYPYAVPVVVAPLHRRKPVLHPAELPRGAIAGHVLGGRGIMPGQSGEALPAAPARPVARGAFAPAR